MENITGNPVTYKNYLNTRLFLVEELKNLLRKCSVIIEAPRRFGKTSVIKEFIRQETSKKEGDREFNILFLELEGEESVNDFCIRLFVAVHGLKLEIGKWKFGRDEQLEIGNWGEMKRVYELDVYRLAEALSDMVWHDIQEVHSKKPNHGCENSSEEKFYLSQTRENTKQ